MGKMNVRNISEGLIEAVREVEGAYLYEIMDRHEYLGLLVDGVTCPCDSLSGDDDDHLFILAFLEVLKHHVKLGQIEGTLEGKEHREIWSKWLRGDLRASRLQRPRNWIDSSCVEILPKTFRLIATTPLGFSQQTWNRLNSGETIEFSHLDYVESAKFKRTF